MLEIKFHGRGGQGIVLASQMLGLAFFKAGNYPQCYSLFGGERRGAPVVSFLRVDENEILLKCEIKQPNELLCFDETLISPQELHNQMVPGSKILVNTGQSRGYFKRFLGFTLGLVDGRAVAEQFGLGHMINTAMVGAYCRLNGNLALKYVFEAVREMVPAKEKANLDAVRQGYSAVSIIDSERVT
ncbi:MAG: 2-oxoacid:acceptor oxidoreductase family protein [Deltaproteobacteria bacterium]|nr:2-oxoacid:acceptor oxidoreductase family protein [Deltaproteobacteria bacterium]MBW2044150.1 2-oxoacid:acceptor oxidoreductase family protein [Deltaproteobacteria bacterium]MBW2300535.1 2-oxoacid:acceptor oxidoreductase family protein [Deltaproteobacteria bacterium]